MTIIKRNWRVWSLVYCLMIVLGYDGLVLTWISEFSDSVHQTISLTLVLVQSVKILGEEQIG